MKRQRHYKLDLSSIQTDKDLDELSILEYKKKLVKITFEELKKASAEITKQFIEDYKLEKDLCFQSENNAILYFYNVTDTEYNVAKRAKQVVKDNIELLTKIEEYLED
jgi:hypothetical protein